jgi:hypothetical protein
MHPPFTISVQCEFTSSSAPLFLAHVVRSLVDSLDTLWLMGLKDEFWDARDWVRDHLAFDNVAGEDSVHGVSFFETTIRSLGGLLAAYDLSRDEAFLRKADDLGSRLVKAYDTPSGLPHSSINIHDGRTNQDIGCLADVGTEQVEFRYLARATGKQYYADKTEKAFEQLRKLQPKDGLLFQDLQDGGGNPFFSGDKVSFGAMGDSTYEYMLKIWMQGGRKEDKYREMWDKAMTGMHEQLLQKSSPSGLSYIADKYGGTRLDHKMDHLVCFMGGSLALSAYTDPLGLESPRAQRDLKTAKAIAYTCYQMYARTKSGLAPEYYQFEGDNDMVVAGRAPFYILRPEAVEAFYYLSRLTGDPIYRVSFERWQVQSICFSSVSMSLPLSLMPNPTSCRTHSTKGLGMGSVPKHRKVLQNAIWVCITGKCEQSELKRR